MRHLWAAGLVLALLLTATPPALAFSPGGTAGAVVDEKPTTVPAGLIVNLLGDVAPEAAAARTSGFALDNGGNGAINSNAVTRNGVAVAKYLPGFKLGYKIGTWIDASTGVYDQDATITPDPDFHPYSNLGATAQGYQASHDTWPEGTATKLPLANVSRTITDVNLSFDQSKFRYNQPVTDLGPDSLKVQFTVNPAAPYTRYSVFFYGTASIVCRTAGGSLDPQPWGQDVGWVYNAGSYTLNAGRAATSYCGGGETFDHLTFTRMAPDAWNNTGPDDIGPSWGADWYPPGHPLDPRTSVSYDRSWLTTVTCETSTGTTISITGTSPKFREDAAAFPQYPTAECPDGSVPTNAKVDLIDPANPANPVVPGVAQTAIPPAWTNWLTQHPNCWTGGCPVVLEQQLPDGTWRSCFTDHDGCEKWADQPTGQFRCTQDGAVIALTDCRQYTHIWDPRRTGTGYSSPVDGSDTDVSKTPKPIDQPGNQAAPTPAPAGGGACYPSGWGTFNPVEWVLKPTECALSWAFEPEPGVITKTLSTTWSSLAVRPPFSLITAPVQFLIGFGDTIGSCTGSIADFGNGLVVPCQPPPALSPYVTTLRYVVMVLVAGIAVIDIWRFTEKAMNK